MNYIPHNCATKCVKKITTFLKKITKKIFFSEIIREHLEKIEHLATARKLTVNKHYLNKRLSLKSDTNVLQMYL